MLFNFPLSSDSSNNKKFIDEIQVAKTKEYANNFNQMNDVAARLEEKQRLLQKKEKVMEVLYLYLYTAITLFNIYVSFSLNESLNEETGTKTHRKRTKAGAAPAAISRCAAETSIPSQSPSATNSCSQDKTYHTINPSLSVTPHHSSQHL